MSQQDTKYLYYKGERTNPFEEVNDQQGAWCERYNDTASMLWCFEYHWANGWAKYSQLEERNPSYYFELHKEPQKEFGNILEALQAFALHSYSGILHNGCLRWVQYVYEHGMAERFYKPLYNVVPAKEVPSYLRWYHGEAQNPYDLDQRGTRSFWWNFERGWYTTAEDLSQKAWEEYLRSWFINRVWNSSRPLPKEQLQEYLRAYEAGTTPSQL
ncbi:MAG: hypothetical protein NC131_09910 [Roseburia sp.]|nr:hypothetical protein [Roseburia sp.]